MLAVQSILCYLAPRGLVIVGGKWTCLNGMSTFSSIDVLQSSHDFGSVLGNMLTVARHQIARLLVCFLDSFCPVFLRVEILAHTYDL